MTDPGAELPSSGIETTGTRPTNVRWRVLVLLMLSAGLFHFNRNSISVAGTEHIMKDYQISEPQMGLVYSSYLFAYTLCMLPGGWLIDRIGPRKSLMIVGFGSFLLVPLTGLTYFTAAGTLLLSLCAVRALLGIVSAPFHPAAARMVSFWIPFQTRTFANGLVTGAAVIGVSATPMVFGTLMDLVGWPSAFLVAGIVTLGVAILWTLWTTNHPDSHRGVNEFERKLITGRESSESHVATAPSSDGRPEISEAAAVNRDLFAMLRNRNLFLLTLSYAAYSYCQYLFFYWLQNYFSKELKLDVDQARLYTTLTNLSMAAGMILGGRLADYMHSRLGAWRGRAVTPVCGMTASALLLGTGLVVKDPAWVVVCFALSMGALGLCEASFWVTAIDLGGRRAGLSGALLNTIGNASGILGTSISPVISKYFGWQTGLALSGVFCLMGAALWWWIDPREQHKE